MCFPQPCIYIIVDVVSYKLYYLSFVFFVKVLNNFVNQFTFGVVEVMAIFDAIFFLRMEVVANTDFRKHLCKNLDNFNNSLAIGFKMEVAFLAMPSTIYALNVKVRSN